MEKHIEEIGKALKQKKEFKLKKLQERVENLRRIKGELRKMKK